MSPSISAPRLEVGDAGQDVAGEIVAGRWSVVLPVEPPTPRSSTRSTAIPRRVKRVGQHQERLVLEERLVAVLGTRAADQDHGRERAGALGLGQRPGQGHAARLVRIGDLDHLVGKRRLRRLRACAAR